LCGENAMAGKFRYFSYSLCVATLCALTFYFFKNPSSEILISDRMSDFIDLVDRSKTPYSKKLIVFDLDDTLIMSENSFGSPTWFYNTVNLLRRNGAGKAEAYDLVRDIDLIVQENINVTAVEQAAINATRIWREKGATIVGISSRPKIFSKITKKQIAQVGLEFASPSFSCIEEHWDFGKGWFSKGLLLNGEYLNKAEVFKQFLSLSNKCGIKTELIAFADDQEHYISDFAKLSRDQNTNFIGIIYGGALSKREFSLFEANHQLLELEGFLGKKVIPEEYRSVFNKAMPENS